MIPKAFLERMKNILQGEEYEAFCHALQEGAVRGLRVNPVKTTAEKLLSLLPFKGEPIPYLKGVYTVKEEKVGALPAHHAGMFYMQDPSAASAVEAAEPRKGWNILDLCAAPGGKTTQLAAAAGVEGAVISNEYVTSRCRILQGNVERMGVSNTVITNFETGKLADFYGAFFDLVVADAPCSGEGMFRKYEVESSEWSEENVLASAARQKDILENAARCVKGGGRLLYSTCTFSLEENERNVADFLERHSDFHLIPTAPAVAAATADGIAEGSPFPLALARRFYPHRAKGEGQFIALMEREAGAGISHPRDAATPLTKGENAAVLAFLREILDVNALPQGRFCRIGENLFFSPSLPIPTKGVFAAGVCIGTLKKTRVEPHHQLFSAFGSFFFRKLSLRDGDPRVCAYLRGEEIAAPECAGTSNGYAAVLYEDAPMGGGKIVSGRLKNHYPKGLRLRT